MFSSCRNMTVIVVISFFKSIVIFSNSICISAIAPCTEERVSLSTSGNSRGLSFTDPTGDATNIINDMWSATFSHSASQQMTDRARISDQALNEASAFPIHEVI